MWHQPQFEVVVTSVSHPFVRMFESQLVQPVSQMPVQVFPPAHVGAMWFVEQGVHEPQRLGELRSVSHPSLESALQFAKLPEQVPPHVPALHVALMWFVEQVRPQLPQFRRSVLRSATLVAPREVVCPVVTTTPLAVDAPAVPGVLY